MCRPSTCCEAVNEWLAQFTITVCNPRHVSLLRDAQLLTDLCDGLILAQQHITFTQLMDNLFGVVLFFRRGSDLLDDVLSL